MNMLTTFLLMIFLYWVYTKFSFWAMPKLKQYELDKAFELQELKREYRAKQEVKDVSSKEVKK